MVAIINITTKQEFEEEVLKSDKPVLVDFWAEWCPPCRAMGPLLKSIAEDLEGTANIIKVNVEESPDNNQLAADYQVQSIPNMVIFKSGNEVDRVIGMAPGATLIEKLKLHS